MFIVVDAALVIVFYVIIFFLLTAGSYGIVDFFNNNLPTIIIICIIVLVLSNIAIFIFQKKEGKKIYWYTPIFSVPSLAQFLFFSVRGIVGIAQSNALFSFFLIIGYIIWLIISGIGAIVSQICCIGIDILHDKYEETSLKAMTIVPPIAVSLIGWFVNYLLFFRG